MSRFNDRSLERLRALLSARPAIVIDAPEYRRAAVLVPLIRRDDGWSILFSRRAENLAAHSGQIAFPGGAVEDGEALEQAAVREAEEEVGIDRAGVAFSNDVRATPTYIVNGSTVDPGNDGKALEAYVAGLLKK